MFQRFFIAHVVFTAIVAGLHAVIVYSGTTDWPRDLRFLMGYALLFVLVGGLFYIVNYVSGRDANKVGMAYLVASTVKMLIALVYLLPIIFGDSEDVYALVIQFLVPYLLYLFFELFWVFRLVRR